MPTGITVLLHGAPGTGKTETVYQLAKESGRNVFKVELSEMKTKWYGESERLVKKIFTDYADLRAQKRNVVPFYYLMRQMEQFIKGSRSIILLQMLFKTLFKIYYSKNLKILKGYCLPPVIWLRI